MNGTVFDAMSQRFATRRSRRRLLGSAALAGVAAPGVKAGQAQAQAQSEASALVRRFYENVDAFQYEQAYSLLGSQWHSRQSLQNFINGYADTTFVQCETTGERTSGSSTIISVELIAWHNDGERTGN